MPGSLLAATVGGHPPSQRRAPRKSKRVRSSLKVHFNQCDIMPRASAVGIMRDACTTPPPAPSALAGWIRRLLDSGPGGDGNNWRDRKTAPSRIAAATTEEWCGRCTMDGHSAAALLRGSATPGTRRECTGAAAANDLEGGACAELGRAAKRRCTRALKACQCNSGDRNNEI